MAYNLWIVQINSITIEAWWTHEIEEFLRNKQILADLNFWTIDPKFSQIVANYMAYNLWKFKIDWFALFSLNHFCQFTCRSLLILLNRSFAPEIKVCSRAMSEWAIGKSDVPSSD